MTNVHESLGIPVLWEEGCGAMYLGIFCRIVLLFDTKRGNTARLGSNLQRNLAHTCTSETAVSLQAMHRQRSEMQFAWWFGGYVPMLSRNRFLGREGPQRGGCAGGEVGSTAGRGDTMQKQAAASIKSKAHRFQDQ